MRHIAIGDIHGCFDALTTLVERIPIADDDIVVTLGDHIDRGPKSRETIDWLIARHAAGALIPLKGNHEIMMLEAGAGIDGALADWRLCGGEATLRSYATGGGRAALRDIPADHWAFVRVSCRDYYETDSHIFVHASADADTPLNEQPEHMLFWEKFHSRPRPHSSGRRMICGHTPQRDGRPLDIGHAVCIDTGAYKDGGWLTALDVTSGAYWQANQARELRAGRLDS